MTAGANYTGGKRNVARTRFRDSTRRVQKNHFGRRRLSILSRGLANGTQHPAEEETAAPGISGILLEHAQREISRLPVCAPVHQTGTHGASTLDPSSSTGSSTRSPNIAASNLRFTDTLDDESCESSRPLSPRCAGRPPEDSSLRSEVLDFSRTVGLCNYKTSPRQGASASPTSRLDSESGRLDPPQQRNENSISPVGGSPGRQHLKACIRYSVQDSGVLPISQTGTSQSDSLGEAASCSEQAYESEIEPTHAEPTPNYEFLEYCNSETSAQSACALEHLPSEDEGSLQVSESNIYQTVPLSPSFNALEFPTSTLPPSSPLTSSTTYGPRLSLYQLLHGAETTLLDFDKVPLPSSVSGSCEVDSSSRYGSGRHITPDLASASPLRHLPYSDLLHKIPALLTSHSNADLIPDLLACDDPWNAIGDILDLPPIPPADATYFNRIRSHHTLPHERVSLPASSLSLGEGIEEPSCTARDEGTQSRAVHSDGVLLNRPGPSSLGLSHQTSRCTPSPLLCRDSPKKALSPERLLSPIHETHLSSDAESHSPPSSPTSGKSPVLIDAPRPLLEPLALPESPGRLHGTSGMGWESSSALVKTLSPSPSILTPQGSPSPDKSNLLKKSVSRSPGVLSSEWNETATFDPVELIHDMSLTEITASRVQLPKLQCPDLFQDEDSLEDMF